MESFKPVPWQDYSNSSIFLMIRRSFPGGGDLGSAVGEPNTLLPLRPSSARLRVEEAKNPLVRGENNPQGSSGALRTYRSVRMEEKGPSWRCKLDSDFMYLQVGSIERKLCPNCKGRGDKLRLCASDLGVAVFSVAPGAPGTPGSVDGTERELPDA